MSIETLHSHSYEPHMAITVAGPEELREIEIQIASQVDPLMTPAEKREFEYSIGQESPLNQFVIGSQSIFVPRLQLDVMPEAYDIATNMAEYGWELDRRGPRKRDATGRLGEYTVGITLTFEQDDAKYEKAVWYVPHPTNFRARRRLQVPKDDAAFLTVRRYVSKSRSIAL